MDEQTVLEGTAENIIYKNDENGYTVFELGINAEAEKKIVCVGYLFGLNEGETVRLTGAYTNHPVYGRQFLASLYEKNVPASAYGIERYLASGAIKGIGEKLAAKIVKEFGDTTLTVMEEYPEYLTRISGITPDKAIKMSEALHGQKEMRGVLVFLQQYNISLAYGTKIYKKFGAGTVEVLKHNPYILCDEISGIGFKTADRIAQKMGVREDSPYRARSAIKYVLNETAAGGHVYLPKDELLQKTSEFLGINPGTIENNLLDMQMDREIKQEKDGDITRIYLSFFYQAEVSVARKLAALSFSGNARVKDIDIDAEIRFIENEDRIQFAQNQKTAIQEALTNGVFIMTGGPGTGKTTTINAIIHILNKQGKTVLLSAPTGRAAKRLSEAVGRETKTIHRMLEATLSDDGNHRFTFAKNEDNPLEADVLIIDECSMLDISLMYHLLKAVPDNANLIFVGDVDQLPSVGPGNVLKDIITSARVRVVALNEVFRQAAKSAIIMNAHRINAGKYPDLNERNKDFFFIKCSNPRECTARVVELAAARLPKYLKTNDIFDIQVLTPFRKSETGAYNLNQRLQQTQNPPSKGKNERQYKEITFREGDKVMHIKNNYDLNWKVFGGKGEVINEGQGVFNGDFGIVRRIDDKAGLEVLFDDSRLVVYDYAGLSELELAYAVTVHKSQGSEYRAVIIPLMGGPPMLMTRNLLYTAITRAKELAVITGSPQALYAMVDNNKEINRYTTLRKRIEFLGDEVSYAI